MDETLPRDVPVCAGRRKAVGVSQARIAHAAAPGSDSGRALEVADLRSTRRPQERQTMRPFHCVATLLLSLPCCLVTPLHAETLALQQGVNGYEGFEDTHTVTHIAEEHHTPHAESTTLAVGQWGSKALIRFDVSSLKGKHIKSAKLTLFCHWHPPEHRSISAHAVLVPWVGSQVTLHEYAKGQSWHQPNAAGDNDRRPRPEAAFPIAGEATRTQFGTWDLTALVHQWVAGTLQNHGVVLECNAHRGSPVVYRSSEFTGYNNMRLDVEYEGVLSQMGVAPHFFSASDCLLDKTGRKLVEQVEQSGAAEDRAALRAAVNMKYFTLAHCDLAIQHHFAADALIGLRRTLDYTGHVDPGDTVVHRYQTLARRQEALASMLEQLHVHFERVFPLVVAPPRNQLMDHTYDREYFEKLYQGSPDFVTVTADMLSRAQVLLDSSKAIERAARHLLTSLGAGGGADWAYDSPLRVDIGFDRKTPVRNFDDNGQPKSIVVGTALRGSSGSIERSVNLDLQDRFRLDFAGQIYTGNYMTETNALANTNATYNKASLPGDLIQPCGNHLGTMYCPLSLFARFKNEGRANQLFDGVPYATQTRGHSLIPNWQEKSPKDVLGIQPVDYTLPEVWEAQRDYLLKVGAYYGSRPDINNIRIAWEPTNSWGTENDDTREQRISYLAEKGHTPSGRMRFQNRMKKKFATIDELNEAWRSSYTAFQELDPSPFFRAYPTDRKDTSPLFYEWELHRRAFFAEWLQHCRDALKDGGCKQPLTVDIWAPSLSTIDNAVEHYAIASVGDIVCSHDNTVSDSRAILLESIQHYFPKTLTGNSEYYWNGSDAQFSRAESVSTACARRNLWRDIAHGSSFFHVFTWTETQPYPGYVPASNYNMADYNTDYSLIRPAAGELQLQHAKLDALSEVFLRTQPALRVVAVYWPTASTINAMPVDVVTRNWEDEYRGIIPSMHSMLFDRGYAYRYVFEQAILDGKEDLSDITVLVLPYAAWLPAAVGDRLTAWVEAGGTLIAAGPIGAETVYGFEDGRAMRKLFGNDFRMVHVTDTEWEIASPAYHAGSEVVAGEHGKGRVVMAVSGFGLFHGDGNRRFWRALDENVVRDAWCTTQHAGKLDEPSVDLAMRLTEQGDRILIVTNLDVRFPARITVGLKGHFNELVDLGVPGSIRITPCVKGANTYVDLRLEAGEGTALRLNGYDRPATSDLDTASMRTEVSRLAELSNAAITDITELGRAELAARYHQLLARGPVIHFEPVRPGDVIVKASFGDGMRLETSDAAFASFEEPERIFGTARVEDGSLLLDRKASGISYTGDGYADANWGGSMGSVINKPFTVDLEFRAKDGESAGTLFDIWYGYTGHFRIRISEGSRLHVWHTVSWWYEPPAFELTTPPCAVADGNWHRVTVTVPNVADPVNGVAIYLDGQLLSRQIDPETHGHYADNGRLGPGQIRGRPVVKGKVMQWGVGLRLDRVNVSTCTYIPPERLDTPLGRYRNLLVTQGVTPPSKYEPLAE